MEIDRICISLNNRCNLRCAYCHFREKSAAIQESPMDVLCVLDNVTDYMEKRQIPLFKIGFVGNGEPLLSYPLLKRCVLHIQNHLQSGRITAYTITNGILANEENLTFFRENHVTVGFSLDGIQKIHDKLRCGTFHKVMHGISLYRTLYGANPPLNCTVGQDVLDHAEETISFFEQFSSRITFSRMIGKYGIPMREFKCFLAKASERLNVRLGGYDCTMYGGLCGAGINNLFYANGYVYLCGNCIDIPTKYPAATPLDNIRFAVPDFDRQHCYKEVFHS